MTTPAGDDATLGAGEYDDVETALRAALAIQDANGLEGYGAGVSWEFPGDGQGPSGAMVQWCRDVDDDGQHALSALEACLYDAAEDDFSPLEAAGFVRGDLWEDYQIVELGELRQRRWPNPDELVAFLLEQARHAGADRATASYTAYP